jgi:acetylornithine deacetylase
VGRLAPVSGADEERVVEAIAAGRDELVALVTALVAFNTTARDVGDPPRDEEALQRFLADRLAAHGAAVDLWEPDPATLPLGSQVPVGLTFEGRPQLAATFPGTGGGRSLLLNGHIDVVTPEPVDRWQSDPWRAVVRDGYLYGRGAFDMKGGVGAMVFAAEVLARLGVRLAGDLVVNTNTDEESSGAGSLACVAHGVRADAGICTEPTAGEVWVCSRGSQSVTITVEGRTGHAEIVHPPWQEGGPVNAIDAADPILAAIRALRAEWASDVARRHRHLAPDTILTTTISGGEWFVSYPSSCTLTANLMYLPASADASGAGADVRRAVEERILAATAADPWLQAHPPTFLWGPDLPPFDVGDDHAIVSTVIAAAAAVGRPLVRGGLDSWFDAASFSRGGTMTMVGYGPGSTGFAGGNAHGIDERVGVDDLVACAQAIALAAMRWCG